MTLQCLCRHHSDDIPQGEIVCVPCMSLILFCSLATPRSHCAVCASNTRGI